MRLISRDSTMIATPSEKIRSESFTLGKIHFYKEFYFKKRYPLGSGFLFPFIYFSINLTLIPQTFIKSISKFDLSDRLTPHLHEKRSLFSRTKLKFKISHDKPVRVPQCSLRSHFSTLQNIFTPFLTHFSLTLLI